MEEIDAVYTWVDGSDPAFQASVRHYIGADDAKRNVSRYRDHGELRSSVRSLIQYAPRVRRIHIVTNGQAPRWLNTSDPRIHVVTHAEIFPDARDLPVFNSHAIEMCLHRVPGLSRRFLYFNDDFFLGRPVERSDFLTPAGGLVVFLDGSPCHSDAANGRVRDRACAFTQNLLSGRWGAPSARRLLPSHAPQIYDREILCRLENLFPDEFRATRARRFRTDEDVALNVLFDYALLEWPEERGRHRMHVLQDFSSHYRFFIMEHRYLRSMHHYVKILGQRPRFLCINDDLGDLPPYHPLTLSLRTFLPLYYWRRAPVERRLFERRDQTFSAHPPSQ